MNCNQPPAFGDMATIEHLQQPYQSNFQHATPSPASHQQQTFFGQNFSHNSSSSSLNKTDGSQFPVYQLGQNFTGQCTVASSNPDNSVFPCFDEDHPQIDNQAGEGGFAMFEMDDVTSGQPRTPADFYLERPGHVTHSQPINIQSTVSSTYGDPFTSDPMHGATNNPILTPPQYFTHQADEVHSAPTNSEIPESMQFGNCSNYGSAISSPGGTRLENLHQQNCFSTSHSTENFNVGSHHQTSFEVMRTGSANENVGCVTAFPTTSNLLAASQQAQQSPGYWNTPADQSAFPYPNAPGEESYNEVFCPNTDNNQQTPFSNYSNHESFNQENVAMGQQSNPNFEIGGCSPAVYPLPIQSEINPASQAGSYSSSTYSPRSVKQEESVFFETDPDQSRTLTEQEKADQKRARNNEACRKSRKKRKMEQEKTEAKVYELTDENSRLKERIRNLENYVKVARGNVNRRISQS